MREAHNLLDDESRNDEEMIFLFFLPSFFFFFFDDENLAIFSSLCEKNCVSLSLGLFVMVCCVDNQCAK